MHNKFEQDTLNILKFSSSEVNVDVDDAKLNCNSRATFLNLKFESK